MQFVDEEVLLNPNTLNETSDFAVEEPFICCHLNLRNRILGFLLCFGIGGTCLISCIPLLGTFIIAPALFAFTYSIGLVLMFASMFFLYGPQAQLRKLIRSPLRLLSFWCVFLQHALLLLHIPIPIYYCNYYITYTPISCIIDLLLFFITIFPSIGGKVLEETIKANNGKQKENGLMLYAKNIIGTKQEMR